MGVRKTNGVTLMRPLPGQQITKGQTVSFTGRFWQSAGVSQFGQCRRITFYMAPDIDVPITSCCGQPANVCNRNGAGNICTMSPCAQNARCRTMIASAYGAAGSSGCIAGNNALFAMTSNILTPRDKH